MHHVAPIWLRRIRMTLMGYVALLLLAYGQIIYAGQQTPNELLAVFSKPLITMVVLVAVYAVYELSATVFLKNQYLAKAMGSLCGALAITLTLILGTGAYTSPFAIGLLAISFIAPALGAYCAMAVLTVICMGLPLQAFALIEPATSMGTGAGVIVLNLLVGGAGYMVWRRFYGRRPAAVENLSSSLSKEQAKSDIILNAIEDGVVLVDANKAIRLFNPGASKITGWPAEEALGLDYHSVLHLVDEKNADYLEEKNPFTRVFAEKKPVRDNQAVLVSRSDKRISLNVSVSPLIDTSGAVTGAVYVFRDVSEERGEEKRRAEFISTASHEMRTPVAAIEGYLALALNEKVSKIDTHAREYLEKAHASTQHLGKLFQDLLTSAKAEDGRLSNHPMVVEMGEFLEKLSEDLRFSAEKKGLHTEFVIGTAASQNVIDATHGVGGNKVVRPLYYATVDPERVREVITNLFDNAVKYTESGTVSLGITGDNDVVQVYIRDTGPGIPAEDIPHLFQKFYRVDSSATRTIGGTGLGLFICRKIVELYNGRVWVESQLGRGSTFFINVPRITTQKAAQLQAAETPAEAALAIPTA